MSVQGDFRNLQGERLARMEVEVSGLKKAVDEHKVETAKKFAEINAKLDVLLALRNKGAGVVWLVSGLIGTGIIGLVVQFFNWLSQK